MIALLLLLLTLQPSTVRERMQEGIRLVQAGKPARGRAIFESIIEENPNHGPARLQLGQLAVSRGDWPDAIVHLEIAVQADPLRPQLAWFLLGRAREESGETTGAMQAFEQSLEIAPDFLPARTNLAELALARDDLWTALGHYREAARQHPERADVQAALANLARRMQAVDLARCAADAALAAEPDSGALHYLRAVIAQNEDDVERAIGYCQRALQLGFDEAAVYVTLGNLYHETMQLTESITSFEKGLELDPAAAESLASFALASLTTAQFSALRPLLELHAVDHPDDVNTLYALGSMNLREGDLDKAALLFEQAGRLAPESSEVQYNLAMTYLRQGHRDEGRAAMDRFRALKKQEDEAWERANARLKLLKRATEAHRAGDHMAAVQIGLPLTRDGAMEAVDLVMIAASLQIVGRDAEAGALLRRALAQSPYDREALAMAAASGDSTAAAHLMLLQSDCPK